MKPMKVLAIIGLTLVGSFFGLVILACIIDAGQTPDQRQQSTIRLMVTELSQAKPGDIMIMTDGTVCVITVKKTQRLGFKCSREIMTQYWTIGDLAPEIRQVVHQHEVPQYGYKCQEFVRSLVPTNKP